MNNFFIDRIGYIRAEFPLLEVNLPCYSFLSMNSIMPICTTTLYHFLSKVIEKVISIRILGHILDNNIVDSFKL